jgi:glycosyltransferase involved in cell wall biosynthesis
VIEQARALARLGHRVAIICPRQKKEKDRSPALKGSDRDAFPVIEVEYPVVRGASYAPCVIALMRALGRTRRYFDPDLIHAHVALPSGFASVVCGKTLRIPSVVTEHWGPIRQLCSTRLGAWGMRFTASRADAMLAVSDHLRREIISELNITRPIHVVPNLYDPAKFYRAGGNGSESQTIDILFVGREGDSRKGNDLVLKSFAKALDQSSLRMRLVLAGSGLEEEMAPMAAELGVAGNCLFTGALPIDKLSMLMRQSAFLVVASRYETFSLVLIEAMACGKPTVATRCGGPEELVAPDTGILVPSDDPESLARAMVEMSRTFSSYDSATIAQYARDNFSDDVIARQLTRVYEGVIDRARRKESL